MEHGWHKLRGEGPPLGQWIKGIHLRRGAFTALRGRRVQPRKGAAAQVEHGRHKLRGEGPPLGQCLMLIHLRRGAFTALRGRPCAKKRAPRSFLRGALALLPKRGALCREAYFENLTLKNFAVSFAPIV